MTAKKSPMQVLTFVDVVNVRELLVCMFILSSKLKFVVLCICKITTWYITM